MKSKMKLLWIPCHCNIPGNDRANELADRGAKLSQKNTIATHRIVKVKIRNMREQNARLDMEPVPKRSSASS